MVWQTRVYLQQWRAFSIAMDRYLIRHPQGRARVGEDERPTGGTTETTGNETRTTRQELDTSRVCSCGKICNERGLKIHRTKIGCSTTPNLVQRTGQPHETEEMNQEAHHSVQHLYVQKEVVVDTGEAHDQAGDESFVHQEVEEEQEEGDPPIPRIKWPPAVCKKEWVQFDEDASKVLQSALAGNVDRKIKAMSTIIYAMGKDRFGLVEKKKKHQNVKANRSTIIYAMGKDRFGLVEKKKKQQNVKANRRQTEISNLRKEQRNLTRCYRKAEPHEKDALRELRDVNRERIRTLRRAENFRKNRRERARKRSQFTANTFGFVKILLGDKRSGRLDCPKEEVESYLRHTHSDPDRDKDLGHQHRLRNPEEPTVEFDISEPKLKEVTSIIIWSKWYSIQSVQELPKPNKTVVEADKSNMEKKPDEWLRSEGCFIPKEEDSKELRQFRTISLINVEGKVCLAILARRVTAYMLENNYIDTSVQKGGVPGVPGCLEHTSVLTKIIQEAKENKGDLTVLWLDLANAYGSIPHKLVDITLSKYHIPSRLRDMLEHYFNNFVMRFTVADYTTAWQRLEVGIITGCTISVVLFSAAMNLLVKSAKKMSRGPVMQSGISQPPTRAFMDDMTITAKSVLEGKWMLQDLKELIDWARMRFKPSKSRSLILRKGKIQDRKIRIGEEEIPTITEKPVKSLGKWFRDSLNDRESIDRDGVAGRKMDGKH